MPSECTKILEFNQYQKSVKAPFIIYADLECILKKTDWCKNNPENLSTTKVREHIPSGCSISTISFLRSIENKYHIYRGKYCMKRFCQLLRVQAMKIINFKEKNEIINKRTARVKGKIQISVIFVKKDLKISISKVKNIVKLEIIVIMQNNIEVLHISYVI